MKGIISLSKSLSLTNIIDALISFSSPLTNLLFRYACLIVLCDFANYSDFTNAVQ